MSDLIDSILLTTNTHPIILGLTLFTIALFLSFTLIVLSITALHSDPYDCEDNNDPNPVFLTGEIRPLLLADGWQDPLKDYPHGRHVISAQRAKKQGVDRALLRGVLEADLAGSSYGSISAAGGPRVGEKRRMRDEGCGRRKRVRVEESEEEESDW